MHLEDDFGRRFSYLRLSLTEVCNFRCQYCLPNGYRKNGSHDFLEKDEIIRLISALTPLGLWKARLTGGEPTLRPDFLSIAEGIASTPGIKRLALTTNGYRLKENAQRYRDAGISHINISIDSLKPETFKDITGHDRLTEVLDGIAAAQAAKFQRIKLNTVLLKNWNDGEFEDILNFLKDQDISLRFIELMRTGDNQEFFKRHHLSGSDVEAKLTSMGWTLAPRSPGAGPAKEFSHPDYQGQIGLIMPYSKDFCDSCNRLRVTSKGELRLCLFGEGGLSLRDLLQRDEDKERLQHRVLKLLGGKAASHDLQNGNTGATRHLASIGG